jgi:hypothetical protein
MKNLLFIILISFSSGCAAQKCELNISETFFNEDILKDENIFCVILSKGLSSIPCLIDAIVLNEKCRVGFYDINSSAFNEFSQHNFKGIKAAYLIEYLIRTKQKVDCASLDTVKVFGYGVIVRIIEGEAQMKPLNYSDMKVIRDIYYKWWIKNRDKDIKEILKEGINILEGSNYIWI